VLALSEGPFKSTGKRAAVSLPWRRIHRHVSTMPSVEPLTADELRPWGSAK
jgi:hypothetical protein